MVQRLPWLVLAGCLLAASGPDGAGSPPAAGPRPPALAAAPKAERATLERLLGSPSWPRRAIAAVRLERFGDPGSRSRLIGLLHDESWQVRCFALRCLARRREAPERSWFDEEQDPRVLRAALRHRLPVDVGRLDRGLRHLAKSKRVSDRLLAAEVGAASGEKGLVAIARETARTLILRLTRAEAGAFSSRLAALTGARRFYRPYQWQQWLLHAGRSFAVGPAYNLPDRRERPEPSALVRLDPQRFSALESYIEQLDRRDVDLAICLDCTASMSGELGAAQSGLDALMHFVGDVTRSLRVAIVAYRDRHDRFVTRGWDFSEDLDEVGAHLWQLTAEGGGDSREAVHEALKMAYRQLNWAPEHTRVLVLVGDAPPHVGYGAQCVDLARRAAEGGLTTHVIEADGKALPYLPEIAEAGEGRCVALEEDDLLIAEIAGLTIGEAFSEELGDFFSIYLELCR